MTTTIRRAEHPEWERTLNIVKQDEALNVSEAEADHHIGVMYDALTAMNSNWDVFTSASASIMRATPLALQRLEWLLDDMEKRLPIIREKKADLEKLNKDREQWKRERKSV